MLGREGAVRDRPNIPELEGRLEAGRCTVPVRDGLVLGRLLNPPKRGPLLGRRGAALRETLVVRVGLTRG
jgi:hypothetical protein